MPNRQLVLVDQVPLELRAPSSGLRPPITLPGFTTDGSELVVRYDGETHANGPRAYTDCREHKSDGCRKYRFLHHFQCRRDCMVWLAAWHLAGPVIGDMADHVTHEPAPELVALAEQAVPHFV